MVLSANVLTWLKVLSPYARARRCPVLTWRMARPVPTGAHPRHSQVKSAIGLHHYGMSGTDIAYRPTRSRSNFLCTDIAQMLLAYAFTMPCPLY
eukprot:2253076-Rhodomonas_salina.4